MKKQLDYEVNTQGIWVTIDDSEPIHFNTTQEIEKLAKDLLVIIPAVTDDLDQLT